MALPHRCYASHSISRLVDRFAAAGMAQWQRSSGVVRNSNLNRRVTHLEYEAYEPLAVKALEQICEEAGREWPGVRLAVHHRIGRLAIGEASIVIAAAERSSSTGLCRVPVRDRASETNRAGLEA